MTTPSNIAATTLALQKLVQTAMPPSVEVTTLTPALAGKFTAKTRSLARVNLALLRISESALVRNLPPARPGSGQLEPPVLPLDLHYLVTAYGTAGPAEEHSVERLLEAVLRVVGRHPILTPAELQAALPDSTAPGNVSLALESLPPSELLNLFANCRAQWRPALTYLARMTVA